MNSISEVFSLLTNVDEYLNVLLQNYGILIYPILFFIIFVETGFVIMPFLPGDSLLFVAGTLAGSGLLNVYLLFVLLSLAAVIGDSVNYVIGKYIGERAFTDEHARFLKKEYLYKTQEFYEKHGGKTIVLARFMPFIRTFAPFVAGIGKMRYSYFLSYNIVGGVLWAGLFIFAGYFLGNIPFVKNNLTIVIFLIIFLSILPGIIKYLRKKIKGL